MINLWQYVMGAGNNKVSSTRPTMIRALHYTDDSECVFWAGDFAGVNLKAVCPVCNTD